MSFFNTFLETNNFSRHDGRPLWKYLLTDNDFNNLKQELKLSTNSNIDPRDAALYYAEWWKKNYNGGPPSKQLIFDSLEGNIRFELDRNEFYKLAVKGARMLGVSWISKQNTLYFRTLLLQGGLPLTHISENHGKYQDFLLAVLEEQPETVEDFIFKPHITSLLPVSSQNDIIYESCFDIVKSILNDENIYDDLLNSSSTLKSISNTLKVRKQSLKRKERLSKPKNYWLLNLKKEKKTITLRIGLADKYTPEALSNMLGFEAGTKDYQFYVNEQLICVFRKMINGNFKTDWYKQQNLHWDGAGNLPYTYVIKDGEKIEVTDFIQTVPNLEEPSLWSKFSDYEWRLLKGNSTSNKEAAILFPGTWTGIDETEELSLYGKTLSWQPFEGVLEITNKDLSRKYLTGVSSLEWTIVSEKPIWLTKSNMVVVQKKPVIILYDENDKKIPDNKFKIWLRKHGTKEPWEELARLNNIVGGCWDVKIEREGLLAYDTFFNLANLQLRYLETAIDHAVIEIRNNDFNELRLDESPILEIENENYRFFLKVKTEFSKIPTGINGYVGQRNQRKLFFEIASPFQGMTITDKEGKILDEKGSLSMNNLYGLRILSTPNTGTLLRIRNKLKPDVIINKEIKESTQPVISFKDDILRLFYLADSMDYLNKVKFELIEGRNSKIYEISGFSHTLNVEDQFEKKVSLFNSDDDLELYAIPLNCVAKDIELIPLLKVESVYMIPDTEITRQFIVISSNDGMNKLMPRFVNTDENFVGPEKEDRIENYHKLLSENSFADENWKTLLSYFDICIKNQIPFSTFDQLRAISRSSLVAARAFFFLGINQQDPDDFIQKTIPELEIDLGFCFHWIKKEDWRFAFEEINQIFEYKYIENTMGLVSTYMEQNNLRDLSMYINDANISPIQIFHEDIRELRAQLGQRVLNELPEMKPIIQHNYHIPIKDHKKVSLLLHSPIAVVESILDIQKDHPIWGGDEFRETIRRNIQYSQYLNREFYNKAILHVLNRN